VPRRRRIFLHRSNSLRKFQSRNKLSDEKEEHKIHVKKEEDAYVTNMKETLLSDGWKPPSHRHRQRKTTKNPPGADGKPLKCYGCKSEYHLLEKCDQKDSYREKKTQRTSGEKVMLSSLLMSTTSSSRKTMNEYSI
jgi:hypothetical protein